MLTLLFVGTAGTLATAAISGAFAMAASLVGAYFLMRTTIKTRADDSFKNLVGSVVEDGKHIRDELWERFEASDARERVLNDRIDKQEDENRECRWQLDRLKADYAAERLMLTAEIDRLKNQITALLAEIAQLKGETA